MIESRIVFDLISYFIPHPQLYLDVSISSTLAHGSRTVLFLNFGAYFARIALPADSYIPLLLTEAGLSRAFFGATRLRTSKCCHEDHGIVFYGCCFELMILELQESWRKVDCTRMCPSHPRIMPKSFRPVAKSDCSACLSLDPGARSASDACNPVQQNPAIRARPLRFTAHAAWP